MFPFDPHENIREPLVFWCFQGDEKGTLGSKGLKPCQISMMELFLRKYSTAKSREQFSQIAPSYKFDRVLNTPLYRRYYL